MIPDDDMSNQDRIAEFVNEHDYIVYTIWVETENDGLYCKVGFSKNFRARMSQIVSGLLMQPCYYCLLAAGDYQTARYWERAALDALSHFSTRGEWFTHSNRHILIRSWNCTFALIKNMAHADGKEFNLLLLPSDWGHYADQNRSGEEIHDFTLPLEMERFGKSWEKSMGSKLFRRETSESIETTSWQVDYLPLEVGDGRDA